MLDQIYSDPAIVAAKSINARRLAKEVFSWDRAVQPLLNLLSEGGRKNLRETDINLDYPDNADLTVTKDAPIEQHFVCRVDGLTRIECRLATHDRKIESPIQFRLFEIDSHDGSGSTNSRLVIEKELDGTLIRNNEWHAVDLDPIVDSAGKTYMLRIDTEERRADNSVAPWAIKSKAYPLLQLNHGNHKLHYSSLCFRTTCARVM